MMKSLTGGFLGKRLARKMGKMNLPALPGGFR
jgi:hypothetical protein